MALLVTDKLRETALSSGEPGRYWLESLPAQVARLEREWGLEPSTGLHTGGWCSYIAATRHGGDELILKLSLPHDEARFEAPALAAWRDRGAVRVHRVSEDGFALLLERCLPGDDLWSIPRREADRTGAEVLRRLWREPPAGVPFERLSDLVARWSVELPVEAPQEGYDPELVDEVVALARDLAGSQPVEWLLHGDFHPGNVLSARREPWLVIDPKPVVGDPAYDLAQWLDNRYAQSQRNADPVAFIETLIRDFSHALGVDPVRVAGWALVKSVAWSNGPPRATFFRQIHRRLSGR